jgi:hypothetical protein
MVVLSSPVGNGIFQNIRQEKRKREEKQNWKYFGRMIGMGFLFCE